MNYKKEKTTPERLFLGLVIGLASSLCVLEYGEPIAAKFIFTGEMSQRLDLTEEDVRITLPELELEKIIRPEKINRQTALLNIVPDAVIVKEAKEPTEAYVFNDSGLYVPDFIREPDIVDDIPFVMVEEKPTLEGLELFLSQNINTHLVEETKAIRVT